MTMINNQDIAAKPQDSESDIVLSVNGVSKKFCRDLKRSLMYGVQDIASELLGIREKSEKLRTKEFWALDNVSFQLRRGESLGLVGKNGSGKSTLLRIIAGLIKPDTGCVEVNGRVAPLIALGAGFNPILTGRENIYANMSILGLSKKEIDERFDEVIDFAEIGDAIDSPVQSYSSGMAARLGFASAIHTKPDILLIDEVLAVGDMKFRAKCYRKLSELRKEGVTFILVSHDSNSILATCDSAIYISHGKMVMSGETTPVMIKYEQELFAKKSEEYIGSLFLPDKPRNESLGLDFSHIYFKDEVGNVLEYPISGNSATLCLGFKVYKDFENIVINLLIYGQFAQDEAVLRLNTFDDGKSYKLSPGTYELYIEMPYCCLRPSLYSMKISISQGHLYLLDAIESFKFEVKQTKNMSKCFFYQPREWHLVSKDISIKNNA